MVSISTIFHCLFRSVIREWRKLGYAKDLTIAQLRSKVVEHLEVSADLALRRRFLSSIGAFGIDINIIFPIRGALKVPWRRLGGLWGGPGGLQGASRRGPGGVRGPLGGCPGGLLGRSWR